MVPSDDTILTAIITGAATFGSGIIASSCTLLGYMRVQNKRLRVEKDIIGSRDTYHQLHQLYDDLKRDLEASERKHEACQRALEQLREDFAVAGADRDRMHSEIVVLRHTLKTYMERPSSTRTYDVTDSE